MQCRLPRIPERSLAAAYIKFSISMRQDYVLLDYKDAFYMTTLGGAKALSIDDKLGNLLPGKEFDALVIDLNVKKSFLDNFRQHTLEEKFQRFIYSSTSHNVISVYVEDRKLYKEHFI